MPLHTSTAGQTPDSRVGNALNVISQNRWMSLGVGVGVGFRVGAGVGANPNPNPKPPFRVIFLNSFLTWFHASLILILHTSYITVFCCCQNTHVKNQDGVRIRHWVSATDICVDWCDRQSHAKTLLFAPLRAEIPLQPLYRRIATTNIHAREGHWGRQMVSEVVDLSGEGYRWIGLI